MPEISIGLDEHNRRVFVFKLLIDEYKEDCMHAQGLVLSASSFIKTAQDPNTTEYKRGLAVKNAKNKLHAILPNTVTGDLIDALMTGKSETVIFRGTDIKGYTVIEPVDAT